MSTFVVKNTKFLNCVATVGFSNTLTNATQTVSVNQRKFSKKHDGFDPFYILCWTVIRVYFSVPFKETMGSIMTDWDLKIRCDTTNGSLGSPPYRLNCMSDYKV